MFRVIFRIFIGTFYMFKYVLDNFEDSRTYWIMKWSDAEKIKLQSVFFTWCRSTPVSIDTKEIDTKEDVDRHPRRPKADMIYQVFKNFKKSLEVFVTPNVFWPI